MRKGQGNYEVFTKENFFEKKGIHPHQIIDLKGMMGDSADNYPGVKGIGEKTGMKLLQEYRTRHNRLENIEQLSPAMKKSITTNLDMLNLSKNLAEIKCDVPISCSLEDSVWAYNEEKVHKKFLELEFK